MTERRAPYRLRTQKRARAAPAAAPVLRAVSLRSEMSALTDVLDGVRRLSTAALHEYDRDEQRATQRAAITTLDFVKARMWQLDAAIRGMLDPLMLLEPFNTVEGSDEILRRFEEQDFLLRIDDDVRPPVASSQVPAARKRRRRTSIARDAASSSTRRKP